MKKQNFSRVFFSAALVAALGLGACKNKSADKPTTVNTTPATTETAPVQVTPDESLQRGVNDAIKDYPGVSATVNDGVVNLSGTIERSRWTELKQRIDGLSPKQTKSDQLIIK